MRIIPVGILPRLRQLSQQHEQMGAGITTDQLKDLDPQQEFNQAIVSGRILVDPRRETTFNGDSITVLLLSLLNPADSAHRESACCEIDVPDDLANKHRGQLVVGARILACGRLTESGALWATSIIPSASTGPGHQ